MIQSGSYLQVIDNSGAKDLFCIKVSKGYRRKYAISGDVITVSVKNIRNKNKLTSKVKKGDVVKAVVVRARATSRTAKNEHINFSENSGALITKQNKLIGTRIFGAVPKKFKFSKFLRIASLCSGFVK